MPVTFNVADLMRTGAVAMGALESMGRMIVGGSGGGFSGKGILNAIGLSGNNISTVKRGDGTGLSTVGGATVSESGTTAGNTDSGDIQNKTMTDQTDSSKSETASAVDESDETKLSDVDAHVVNIVEILRDIANGTSILKVNINNEVKVAQGSSL
jgi:hypothetical protein